MPLHPQIHDFLERYYAVADTMSLEQISLEQLRHYFNLTWLTEHVEPVKQVQNRMIPGQEHDVPIRVYTPEGDGPHPALVYYHGGGFILGGLDSHDSICRVFANAASCVVVSVDYRLAPEHKFPAAVEDAFASLNWVADHADELNVNPSQIAVGGDSAGGNLSAVMAIKAKEQGSPPLTYQLLIYPAVSTDIRFDFPSMTENANGYLLTVESIRLFYSQYLRNEEDAMNPYSSPLLYKNVTSLPPAMVITAEFDPLRDEGKAYAERLQQAGVPVHYTCYKGMIHQFFNIGHEVDAAKAAIMEAALALKDAFTK
ncbi:alpha/beta hydrolase [Paenibacillus sp. OSY-SE]|uniref:alpha/beta hydrolase n=1 Tax=Paenibacillus sp. OSY-SE TaxID=1196323 RepID=UPI000370456B|nr:alpha/beta hydrolase [Paenibacillus sp. OSY-SE]